MEKKTLEQIRGEFDKERIKEWDKTAMETYKQATQDTPEEWGEEFDRLYRTSIGTLELKDYVKQLLEDKEKSVKKNLLLELQELEEWKTIEGEYDKDKYAFMDVLTASNLLVNIENKLNNKKK